LICKICKNTASKIFRRNILNRYEIDYFQCSLCGFIQTEEPYWLKEAYHAPITMEDTGIIKRNILSAKRTSTILYFLFNKEGRFLDYGGGYGLVVRLMRDYGFDYYWTDPYTENLFARGFSFNSGSGVPIELLTAFECFEHFVDPLHEIEKMLSISGSILFSTDIFSSGTPDPERWQYYYFSHGQHIALYSIASLKKIAEIFNLHLYTNGKSFHLLTQKVLSRTLFNGLLKSSLLGIPSIIKMRMGSKTRADSNATERRKYPLDQREK
jgi:hypothetical protein